MALTFAQRKKAVRDGLRRAKSMSRRADTAGEKLERELIRLIARKTFITPEELRRMTDLYASYGDAVNAMQTGISAALIISQQQI